MTKILEGKIILIADDLVLNQTIVKKVLEKQGADCHIANNGLEVLEMTKKQDYDLVLLDVNMPLLDGIETTKALCDLRTDNIVALTADLCEEKKKQFAELGVHDIIYKPYRLEVFIQKLSDKLESIEK